MRLTGIVALMNITAKRTPVALMASALLLSACVDPFSGEKTTSPSSEAAALPPQPEIVTDPTIYAARSDGRYTVPALPVDQIPASHRRQLVEYPTDQAPGTIIIDPTPKLLYYILGNGKAIRYGISVGAEGFQWSGESIVARKGEWPTWYPPKEMIARKPSLEKWANGQPGGPSNPLGSRAIYLTSNGRDYGYRIHGTPEWKTIGRNASSGCFRMIQQDVMDLYERVRGGEKVIVLTAKGEMPTGLSIPKPIVPKKKAAPKVEATPAATTAESATTPATGAAGTTSPTGTTVPAADSTTTPSTTAPSVTAPSTGTTTAPSVTSPSVTTPSMGTTTAPAAPAPSTTVVPEPTTGSGLPAVNLPSVAPSTTPAPAAPAATPAPATSAPAAAAPACAVPLVNGTCPAN